MIAGLLMNLGYHHVQEQTGSEGFLAAAEGAQGVTVVEPNLRLVRMGQQQVLIEGDGVIELAGNKPEMQHDIEAYFASRDEDATTLS